MSEKNQPTPSEVSNGAVSSEHNEMFEQDGALRDAEKNNHPS